jgi:hypothetical protein
VLRTVVVNLGVCGVIHIQQGSRILSRAAIAKNMGCGMRRDLLFQIHMTFSTPYKGSAEIGEWECDITTPAWRLREEAD